MVENRKGEKNKDISVGSLLKPTPKVAVWVLENCNNLRNDVKIVNN